jgi:hypothetical protein
LTACARQAGLAERAGQKSISSACCPILMCSAFESTAAAKACDAPG